MKLSLARLTLLILSIATLLPLVGCAHLSALVRANDIERQAKIDRLEFLETTRDAYFLIGNQYYTLAKIAEDQGDVAKTQEFTAQVRLYALIYNDLKARALEMRTSLEAKTRSPRSSKSEPKAGVSIPDSIQP